MAKPFTIIKCRYRFNNKSINATESYSNSSRNDIPAEIGLSVPRPLRWRYLYCGAALKFIHYLVLMGFVLVSTYIFRGTSKEKEIG